jgi:serine/threonine-protein kinase
VDRSGREEVLLEADRRYSAPRLSPDGKSVAVTVEDGNPDVWIYQLDRKVLHRLTFSPRSEHTPIWYPDSRRIAFVIDIPPFHLYAMPADGSSEPTALLERSNDSSAETVSPDGRFMVVRENSADNYNVGLLELNGGSELRPLRVTPFRERFTTLSPKGRFMAYESDESGREEIYIQSFPDAGLRVQVTRDGGEAPIWAGSSELFYWVGDRCFAVAVATTPGLEIGEPEALFTSRRFTTNASQEYDVTADGRRIVMVKIPEASKPREVQVVLNWFSDLERLAGRGGAK